MATNNASPTSAQPDRDPGPDADLANGWAALSAAEDAAIAARRRQVLGEAAASANPAELKLPRVGLALSGGGVRSATFALGLLRGLAQSRSQPGGSADPAKKTLASDGLLGRLDYLSTVSGGGYIGAMYGRLVATYGLARAQRLMACSRSSVLEWLRCNGRYLTPSGSRDIGIAAVTYLRAWLAIHSEFMFTCLPLGLLVMLPHLWQHSVQVLHPQGWERWHTPWWPLSLAFWAVLAPGLIAAFWSVRDARDPAASSRMPGWRDALFLLAGTTGAFLLFGALQAAGALDPVRLGLNLPGAGMLALASLVVGQLMVMGWMALSLESHALKVARLRNWLTRTLRVVLLGAVALAGLGVLDRLSWWVLEEFQTGNQWLWGGVGAGGLAVIMLRALTQPLQQLAARSESHARDWLPRLLNLASLGGLLVLVMAWLVLLQWFVFAPETFSALRSVPAWMRASLLGGAWLAWLALTAGNAQMANTSSLHSFYHGRLSRAYLAVGNLARRLGDDASGSHADVTKVVDGDDLPLHSYRPETQGGPIHLVNACLNQTRDDKSGLYNADRKGTAVTATWRGFEVGPREFVALQPGHDAGTLGRWVAVSGAAASSGAGAYTSRGLALLVYLLGVRLGYWMRTPSELLQLRPLGWLSRLAWRVLPKPLMLASEASATFYGMRRPWWFLSDGGHFENSGVYPLLKREANFIILSDAGCDAHYEFGDIENLVRKARIDFGAEIDFYSGAEASGLFTLGSTELTVLSPEDMANNHSCRGVLLARIRYRERPGPAGADGRPGAPFRPEATLLVIKPNLHDALDVDLLAYAQKHESFPHESTGDQSFDEAQWESYHRLGEDFGRALSESWLSQLPGWRSPARHAIRVAARLGAGKGVAVDGQRAEPLWRRSARAAAIGTTLGVGASGTVLLSLWQVQDQLQRNRTDEQTEARELFTEVSKGLQSFKGSCPQVPEHVVAQAAELLRLRGSPTLRPFEQAGLDRLGERIAQACSQSAEPSADCMAASERIQKDLCTEVQPPVVSTAMNYWHPGASPSEQESESLKVLQAVTHHFPGWGADFMQRPPEVVASVGTDVASSGALPAEATGRPAGDIRTATAPAVALAIPVPAPELVPASASASASEPTATTATAAAPEAVAAPALMPAAPANAAPATAEPVPVRRAPVVVAKAQASPAAPAALGQPAFVMPSLSSLQPCQRESGRTILYVQIYDEASRLSAVALRQALQAQPDVPLVVAPVENVTRSADLRQQRKPVPWPQPTLMLHDPASRHCAQAIAKFIGVPWVLAGDAEPVWLRNLPRSLPARPGVIELWLPPVQGNVSQTGGDAVQRTD